MSAAFEPKAEQQAAESKRAAVPRPRVEMPAEGAAQGPAREQERSIAPYVWALTRISLGFVFLWAFLDKTFGLGRATPTEGAWIDGGSPTEGYLASLEGTFAGQFGAIAGDAWADWLFMVGLLGIGLALILGVFMRIAAATGALLLVLMWLTALPLENNPVIDDHIVYTLVLVGLAASGAADTWGLGKVWKRVGFVRRFPVLR